MPIFSKHRQKFPKSSVLEEAVNIIVLEKLVMCEERTALKQFMSMRIQKSLKASFYSYKQGIGSFFSSLSLEQPYNVFCDDFG